MKGELTHGGTPILRLNIAGEEWVAIIDTGFSGDLELPQELSQHFQGIPSGKEQFLLAGGIVVTDDMFVVDFPFDGEILSAQVAYAEVSEILIGTGLLKDYRLEIDFHAGTLELTRVHVP
jgi:predicted aspartyl protease